ncbi:uncharacterized protein LOC122626482 [Drosophila teissieri]|uniref:uncharacterized protein LOC122626482 n=1 Tax=Drosophila teissieri TaxID=7243 RepID=UPI001CB9F97F|nr:uncharacterized protein LOC122626482 [Drosophila teissieri]
MQRHKMQITRRNNQIENETEQNAIKVDDEPNGNCSTKATEQSPRAQDEQGSGVQLGRIFPRPQYPLPSTTQFPSPFKFPFALDNTQQLPAHRNQQSTNICIAPSPLRLLAWFTPPGDTPHPLAFSIYQAQALSAPF